MSSRPIFRQLPQPGAGKAQRYAAASVPAGLVTILLFTGMNRLIQVTEISEPAKEQRVLLALEIPNPYKPENIDVWPEPPVNIDVLPRPPVESHTVSDVPTVPVAVYTPAPPVLDPGIVELRPPVGSPIIDRVPTAVRPPLPTFPTVAAQKGISGSCEVRFSLTVQGLPYNVTSTCSDPAFEKEARRSVSKAEFLPRIEDGKPVESHNLMYPLEFRLN
ncbi:MAG: energy transducer TonB [Hyphomonas sp.]|uniref:energy transducer TonB n=1 Tax=Hyphomonas sp. TaxID=87 RepID=UPI003528928F